ncbi:hypothetical protein VB005_04116 [Metarhizium brunneum]
MLDGLGLLAVTSVERSQRLDQRVGVWVEDTSRPFTAVIQWLQHVCYGLKAYQIDFSPGAVVLLELRIVDTIDTGLPFNALFETHANLPSSDPAKVSEGVAGDQADVTDLQEVLRSTRNDLTASASDARKPKEKAVGTKTKPEWTNG